MHKGVCVSGSREQTAGSVSSQQYPRLPFIMLVIVITEYDGWIKTSRASMEY